MNPPNQVETYDCVVGKFYWEEGSVVGLVCVLSILGSSLLLLIYVLNKANRTVARTILVHLSVSNIGQAVASLVGIVAHLSKFHNQNVCRYQALATMYFNINGMLWTVCLAMYLYLLVLGMTQSIKHILWFFSVPCYLIPLLVTCWLFFTQRAGLASRTFPIYCALADNFDVSVGDNGELQCVVIEDIIGKIFGYGLWVLLTIILTLLFYVMALCGLKILNEERVTTSAMFRVDYKLITIPVIFTLLRVWSLILLVYVSQDHKVSFQHGTPPVALRVMTGIGNNAQGFLDALIFVVLTDTIRRNIIESFSCCYKTKAKKRDSIAVVYTKNAYDSSLVNHSPRGHSISSSPIDIKNIRINGSPEPTTSFKDSPSFGSSYYF